MAAIGAGASVIEATGLHDGSSPWLLRIEHAGRLHEAILRAADGDRVWSPAMTYAAAAMVLAAEHGMPTSRLLASDLDGKVTGAAALLETVLPGRSDIPARAAPARLRSAGAALAKLHAIPLLPCAELPLRVHPIPADDYALERRWACRYQQAPDDEKPAVLQDLYHTVGWPPDSAREVLPGIRYTPLLLDADDRVRRLPRPETESVFAHGDVWSGNLVWERDHCVGLIDWKSAGAGHPGVDLGSLRVHMAVQYGLPAAGHVLEGWQHERGRAATDVAYWDAVAALNTSADMTGFWPAFDEYGHQLPGASATERRDAFLRAALDRLPS
jgi:aminoglycoside phosphotransferase (APT) family kinase protein